MVNQDIRQAARAAGVKLWQVAEALEIADTTFSKRLRRPLPEPEREKILTIIQLLSQEVTR